MHMPSPTASASALLPGGRRWRVSRSAQGWIRVLLVCAVLAYALYYYYAPPIIVIDKNHGQHTLDEHDDEHMLLEKVCSPTTSICYSVVDIISKEELTAKRAVYLHGFEHEYDTLIRLIPPDGKSVLDSDTRMWSVNHTTIASQYIAAMIAAPFITAAIPLDASHRDVPTEMMVVGLGGGSLDMFYHYHRHEINITVYEMDPLVSQLAHRWFGVVEDATRRTIIQDGVHAIHEAVEKKLAYDAIFIDACDTTHELPCPAPDFITPAMLKAIKSILKPMGTVIFNVLPLEHEEQNVQMMRHRLTLVFPTCVSFRMELEMNIVFACMPYHIEPDNVADTKRLFGDRLVQVKHMFGFADVLRYVETAITA